MLKNSKIDENTYSELMNTIKKINSEYKLIRKSKTYKIGKAINMSFEALKHIKFREVKDQYIRWNMGRKAQKYLGTNRKVKKEYDSNYFSEEKIVVYTVIFGKYDYILEPYCKPNNIEYYIITDQEIDLRKSSWKKMDISKFESILKNMNNTEKNRFFKMKPHLIFPQYKYSVYVDGNIQIVTDMTEYIYRIGECGLAAHMHSMRDCVYEESNAIIFAKKDTKENIDNHIKHLKEKGFPKHYGMLECNVLVRQHNEICCELMNMWWDEFCNYCKRDQISLPYVLYNKGINVDDVGTLGNNVFDNPSFRVVVHS